MLCDGALGSQEWELRVTRQHWSTRLLQGAEAEAGLLHGLSWLGAVLTPQASGE